MSEENSKIKDVLEAATGFVKAVPVYDDAIQPAAKEIGKSLLTVSKAVNVALAPLKGMVWGYEQIENFILTKVAERLKNTPPENITTPKPNIAGPILESLRFTGHEESLSDLYANLLAASMDKNTAPDAHPSFAEIIRQITPDEAKLINLFRGPRAYPLLNLRWNFKEQTEEKQGGREIKSNFSLLGFEANCEFPNLTPTYIDNLARLGIIEIPAFYEYTAKGTYDLLENHPEILELKLIFEKDDERALEIERKGFKITDFGKQFVKICLK